MAKTGTSLSANSPIPESMRRDELADEIHSHLIKLESLCAVQVLLVQEGLNLGTKHQVGLSQTLEEQVLKLRDCLGQYLE